MELKYRFLLFFVSVRCVRFIPESRSWDDFNQIIYKSHFKSFPMTHDFYLNQFLAMIRDFELKQIFNDFDLL